MKWFKLKQTPYIEVYNFMREFTETRTPDTEDIVIMLEHCPTYTYGITTPPNDVPRHTSIPSIQTNRGGKLTYHGPGQCIFYPLLNLKRLKMSATSLILLLEETVVDTAKKLDIEAYRNPLARGIYVDGKKIASCGIRVSKGCSYHGLSINIDMDLSPFNAITVCGDEKLDMVQFSELTYENSTKIEDLLKSTFLYKLRKFHTKNVETIAIEKIDQINLKMNYETTK